MTEKNENSGATESTEQVIRKKLREGWQPAANAVGADPSNPPKGNPSPGKSKTQAGTAKANDRAE